VDDAIRNKTIFMDWFNSNIMPQSEDPLECSKSLTIYAPSTTVGQNLRNRYKGPPDVPFFFSNARISVYAEVPDNSFTVGQAAVNSTVTLHEEYFPVSVDFMVAKGCDGILVKLAQDLVEAGIITIPLTGQTIHGGEILK
jgi:hypothetical protein